MENNTERSAFRLKGYKIIRSLIEISKDEFDCKELNINIKPSGIQRKKTFDLTLVISISDDSKNINIEIETIGYFEFKEDLSNLPDYFSVNAPALIFPYIRAYISLVTSISGIDSIILPTLNLISLGEKLHENIYKIDESE